MWKGDMNAEFLKVLAHYPELSRRHTASAAVIAPAAILHGTTSKDAIPPTASPDPLINVSQGQTEGRSGGRSGGSHHKSSQSGADTALHQRMAPWRLGVHTGPIPLPQWRWPSNCGIRAALHMGWVPLSLISGAILYSSPSPFLLPFPPICSGFVPTVLGFHIPALELPPSGSVAVYKGGQRYDPTKAMLVPIRALLPLLCVYYSSCISAI
ncbi:hypothetical protein HOY82DRAFT_641454 [Tuber indicum]|nr:hypothetical protein HOY82DRAFT_641454 [Tuber indicum]